MGAKTYSSSQVIITINGISIEGKADGSFFSNTQNEDRYTLKVGADGEGTRSRSANRSSQATISVMQGSNGSVILDGFKKQGDAGADDTFVLDVIDVESGSTLSSGTAWIIGEPDLTYDLEVGTEDWVIEMISNDIDRAELPTVG